MYIITNRYVYQIRVILFLVADGLVNFGTCKNNILSINNDLNINKKDFYLYWY